MPLFDISPPDRCDIAFRRSHTVLQSLANARRKSGLAVEDLVAKSGLRTSIVVEALSLERCGLTEFLCLCSALGVEPAAVIKDAMRHTPLSEPVAP